MTDRCAWPWAQACLLEIAGRREAVRSLGAAAVAGLAATGPSPVPSAAKKKKKKKQKKSARPSAMWVGFVDEPVQPTINLGGTTVGSRQAVDLSGFDEVALLVLRQTLSQPNNNAQVRLEYSLDGVFEIEDDSEPLTDSIDLTDTADDLVQTAYTPIPPAARRLVVVRANAYTTFGTSGTPVRFFDVSMMARAG